MHKFVNPGAGTHLPWLGLRCGVEHKHNAEVQYERVIHQGKLKNLWQQGDSYLEC